MMYKEVKDKYLKALRSGEFKQNTEGCLNYKDECLCAYGVLCELAFREGICSKVQHEVTLKYLYGQGMSRMYLPKEVERWSNINDNKMLLYKDVYESMYALNDTLKLDFNRIANLVEVQW